jgi:hypothetical protein
MSKISETFYKLIRQEQSDNAISYFFENCVSSYEELNNIFNADVELLNAELIVAILLGTRVRKSEYLLRSEFLIRAKSRLLNLLPEKRVNKLWKMIE